ncbi:tetratricopeptide repeat protein [Hymenobacter sp. J193]|uniref:tetratricopeptide repeat-containing sensor histidine kinase n=1 Tax=Hymenobacter sp. J193 TaxID=2898429 RepID=UPI0021515573|nr:tetratricopeptide repeat protein [Hymenobacter sp. J193]MCR5889435.1 tetratricopeptide repeat protein [Hymenobacter sp. J193]
MRNGYILMGWWLMSLLSAASAAAQPAGRNARLDSLEARLPQLAAPDTNRVNTLNELIWENRDSNPRRALSLATEALRLGRQLNHHRGLAKTYILRGIIYATTGRYPEAIADFEACRRQRAALQDWQGVAGAINNVGEVLAMQGRYQEAVRQYIRALKLEEKYGTPERIATDWANIGMVYQQMGRYREALRYHLQYLHLPGRTRDAHNDAQAHNIVGQDFAKLNQPDSAQAHYQHALRISQRAADRQNEAQALAGLGTLAGARQQAELARSYFLSALTLARQLDDQAAVATNLNSLGELALRQRQPAAAVPYFEEARRLSRRIQAAEAVRTALQGLATAYAQLSRYAEAYQFQQQVMQVKDSLLNEASARQITEMQVRYDTERKEAQNQLQAAQLRTQQQLLRRRNVQLLAGLVVMGLLGLVGWLLYTRQRLREQVAHEQERQQQEHRRVAAVLEAEENERRRIGSDLHDGIGQLLTAAKLNLHALDQRGSRSAEDQAALLHNAIDVVDESFREVRGISHNLMPNALMKQGLAAAVRDLTAKMTTYHSGPHIEVEVFGLNEERLPPTMESVLFRVIQELMQNVIKHAQAQHVTLQLVRNPTDLTVIVEDDGVGFDPLAPGKSGGIGLRNIQTRLTYLGGRAHIDTTPGHGTTVTLEVPLATQTGQLAPMRLSQSA